MRTALVFTIGLLFGGIVSVALISKPRIYNTDLITQGECLTALTK